MFEAQRGKQIIPVFQYPLFSQFKTFIILLAKWLNNSTADGIAVYYYLGRLQHGQQQQPLSPRPS